jgi:D-glycero-alpha-D-manno-heptose 1-phosphate guanylyltransferase
MADQRIFDTPLVILAGGLGTRLRELSGDVPKPLVAIHGRPFLHYLLSMLYHQGFREAWVSIGYGADQFSEILGNNCAGVRLMYLQEQQPLGTGGALMQAARILGRPFFAINGDTYHIPDFHQMQKVFEQQDADLVMGLKRMNHFDRYGTVILNDHQRVLGFQEKQALSEGLINAGNYLISPAVFDKDLPEKFSFEKDILERDPARLKIMGVVADSYFMDIGIPSDYFRFCEDVGSGKII